MNMTGVGNGVAGIVARDRAAWGMEIAYVRRDSFWIEHEGRSAGKGDGQEEGDGRDASQATAPIFVPSKAIAGRAHDEDAAESSAELDVPARGWTKVSSPWVLALTASAFALGVVAAPLVRSGHAPAQISVVPPAVAPAAVSIPSAPAVPPSAPAVPPPAPAPVATEVVPSDAEAVAAAAPITRAARTPARSRASAGSSSGAWSSRAQVKKETKRRPVDADEPAVKAPVDTTPSKKAEPSSPKKPAPKAWVDPWAGTVALVTAG